MLDAITSSQLAMNQDKLQLQSITQNIANIHTPGYKRELMNNGPFEKLIAADKSAVSANMTISNLQRQGSFSQTNKTYDVAISGQGFFMVEGEQGVYYTRRGDFHLNKHGELVTFDGKRVMGASGSIRLDGNKIKIQPDGTITSNNKPYAQLKLVKFEQPSQLHSLGSGYFSSTVEPLAVDSKTLVLQGFIEQSNVKSIEEMVAMTTISRHFESNQRVMKTADNLLSQAINQLGEG